MKKAPHWNIRVTPNGPTPHGGLLRFGPHHARCALGKGGLVTQKCEGDKKTPIGRFGLRRIWVRPDRLSVTCQALPITHISRKSGWSDDVFKADYNRPVTRPYHGSHEKLWRLDRLYDVFIELGINDEPVEKHRGSAVFLHLEKNNFRPTLGCVAVSLASMAFLLRHIRHDTFIDIQKGS